MQYRDLIQLDPKQVKEGEQGFSPSIKTQYPERKHFMLSRLLFLHILPGPAKTVMTSTQKTNQVHSSHSAGDLTHCKAHANFDLEQNNFL